MFVDIIIIGGFIISLTAVAVAFGIELKIF